MVAEKRGSQAERRGIQSIEVGFTLIRVLEREGRKLPLKTLAAEAGMPSSKAHLYLASFMRLGLVVQDSVTAHYGLGPYAIQLGLAGINQLSVVDVAREPMEALQAETGVSVTLSIWGNMGPTIIFKLDGPLPIPMIIRVGYVLPLLSSATGRIFLSHLPEREWRALAEREAAVQPDKLEAVLRTAPDIRERGLALSDSQLNEGFAALSAPIFDHDGQIVAAMTVLGMRSMMDRSLDGSMARALRAAAGSVSGSLGKPRLGHGTQDAPRPAARRPTRKEEVR